MLIRNAAELGVAIRERRKLAGLDLTEAAELLGVSRRLLIELEHGRREASVSTVLRILAALGLDVRVLPRGSTRESSR
ncbi:MAG: helix-turn-helix transcriptional regulator [Gemmatimonadaceae bacterium]